MVFIFLLENVRAVHLDRLGGGTRVPDDERYHMLALLVFINLDSNWRLKQVTASEKKGMYQ